MENKIKEIFEDFDKLGELWFEKINNYPIMEIINEGYDAETDGDSIRAMKIYKFIVHSFINKEDTYNQGVKVIQKKLSELVEEKEEKKK